jgi:hypothetical protein
MLAVSGIRFDSFRVLDAKLKLFQQIEIRF